MLKNKYHQIQHIVSNTIDQIIVAMSNQLFENLTTKIIHDNLRFLIDQTNEVGSVRLWSIDEVSLKTKTFDFVIKTLTTLTYPFSFVIEWL